jgi:hypothetical protein
MVVFERSITVVGHASQAAKANVAITMMKTCLLMVLTVQK